MKESGPTRRRRVTLEDVARHASVSRALVSIVMRDAPGASAKTRARVLAAAEELGYRPDVRARSLAGQTSRLIGVMFGLGVGSFHFELLEGLYAAAEDYGHGLILSALTKGRDERKAVQSLNDFRFDALVALGPATPRPLLAGVLPVAVVGWHVEDPQVDVVRTSDEAGMSQAVAHLVGLGHRRIAHVDGGVELVSAARRAAYAHAMQAAGLAVEIRVLSAGPTQFAGLQAARDLLDSGDLPTAIIAYNDDVAVGAIDYLAQHGVVVPQQIAVIGWDDSDQAVLSPVGLTSVAQRPDLMARLAVERLIGRIERKPIEGHEIVLEPELMVRRSTAPPPPRLS